MSSRAASVRGNLDEIEEEALAVVRAQAAQIHDGQLNGLPWFVSIVAQVERILRRRRAFEARRHARS